MARGTRHGHSRCAGHSACAKRSQWTTILNQAIDYQQRYPPNSDIEKRSCLASIHFVGVLGQSGLVACCCLAGSVFTLLNIYSCRHSCSGHGQFVWLAEHAGPTMIDHCHLGHGTAEWPSYNQGRSYLLHHLFAPVQFVLNPEKRCKTSWNMLLSVRNIEQAVRGTGLTSQSIRTIRFDGGARHVSPRQANLR